MIRVIADTGAIIALLDEDDKHHTAVVEVAQSFDLLIPVTVLPEVDYLVTKYLGEAVVRSFLEAMTEGAFIYLPIEIEEIRRTTEIMARYSDIPIGFVDASLVALAESHNIHRILTLDRRHFNIIRLPLLRYHLAKLERIKVGFDYNQRQNLKTIAKRKSSMISAIFERFVEATPLTVMVRAIMERSFAAEQLEKLFEETAQEQYTKTLLFSNVVGLMSLVVCGMYPSVGAAYQAYKKVVGVSKVALYDKINGLEPRVAQALVRYSSEQVSEIKTEFRQANKSILAGYEVRIVDGNHIGSTEHRLKVLREESAGALPGQAIAVLDPQRELVVDVFPSEDAHAQERSLFPLILETVKAGQAWIADRNFCTKDFLT